MAAIRTPRSLAAATACAERFAALEAAIGGVEAQRNAAIAEANAEADKLAEPLLSEREEIRARLGAWWPSVAAELTKGKRKSIELGGCLIGSRKASESLTLAGAEDTIVAALQKRKWAEPLLRTTTRLERRAVLGSLDGVYKRQLAELGLGRAGGGEVFFVNRAEQAGTLVEIGA